jgi:hypothetical protein
MGQLQQALLVVGALIIAAVVAFNLWQSWQLRRRRPRSEGAGPLMGDEPGTAAGRDVQREPGLDDEPQYVEPQLASAEPTRLRPPALRIDPLIDAIASFMFEQPVPGESLLSRMPRDLIHPWRQAD